MRAGWLGVVLVASGCQFVGPPTSGTEFRCDDGLCPTGFTCRAGFCQEPAPNGTPVDASQPNRPEPGQPDGRPDADDPEADARVDARFDAAPEDRPDARPDARVPVTRALVFGELVSADVRNVTTDTWLDSANTDTNRGTATELQIDREPSQVMLVRFDVSAIPADAVVEEAVLHLQLSDAGAGGDRVTVRTMLRGWNEREATWNNASNGQRWPTAGAGGTSVGGTLATFEPDFTGDINLTLDRGTVQGWVDDAGDNFGMRLDVQSSSANDVRVRSREGAGNGRPSLRVTFRE